jgi:hypothetical protein
MFVDSGASLPSGARTVSPAQVTNATLEAIVHNRSEVDVAPVELRLAGALAGLFPEFFANAQRKLSGTQRTVRELVDGQRHKR